MKIAVLGTGTVGHTIASALVALNHEVRMGARSAGNEKAAAWATAAGVMGTHGTFADACAFGEAVFNCTAGAHSLAALKSAEAHLAGKIVVDLANPLDFSKGMPPRLTVCNDDSLGETLQRELPEARIVKSLNTVNHLLMVDPSRVPGEHAVFVAGNDPEARGQVARWLTEWFGWSAPVDLGDITAARALEMWLPLWVRLWGALGTADFNVRIVRA